MSAKRKPLMPRSCLRPSLRFVRGWMGGFAAPFNRSGNMGFGRTGDRLVAVPHNPQIAAPGGHADAVEEFEHADDVIAADAGHVAELRGGEAFRVAPGQHGSAGGEHGGVAGAG